MAPIKSKRSSKTEAMTLSSQMPSAFRVPSAEKVLDVFLTWFIFPTDTVFRELNNNCSH